MSSPMVGKHVRSLEKRLGVRLITRTTRSQKLTEFGRAYYERFRLVLGEVDASDAITADQRVELRGTLRLTMPALFGRCCVVPLLLEFAKSNPQRMIVCASPAYLSRHGNPGRLEELGDHHAVIYGPSRACTPWLFPRERKSPIEIVPRVRLQIDDLDALAEAAVAGFGMAWLPSWLIRERLQNGSLVSVLPNVPQHHFGVYASWVTTPYMPLGTRAAIDALSSALPRTMEGR